ncbi:hypothetical protein O0L34_g7801 [Tuta absoluta]|nr:hypothetical protein O0L34_g7801 [Tuta absoluta]
MIALEGKTVFHKLWYGLRRYILVLKVFDIFLQGTLLVVTLLETNVLLLLRRDAGTGYLRSLLEGWVLMGASSAVFVLGMMLGWIGKGKRQFTLSACLGCTALAGLLVLAFPYKESSPPAVELCGGGAISPYSGPIEHTTDGTPTDNLASYRIAMLVITLVMCGFSTISIWAHGLTYLDDHNPQNGAYFYGILISIQLSLGLGGKNWLIATAFKSNWWKAHLPLSMLVLMFSILFTLFPTEMPQWRSIETTEDTGFVSSAKRMIRNKVLCVQILALSLLYAALFGLIRLDENYVQARFHVEAVWTDPQTSRGVSDIFRTLIVIFFTMIFRLRFSIRSDGVKANTSARVGGIITIFIAIFFAVIAILQCPTKPIAGLVEGGWQQLQCNGECGCDSSRYGFTPVCDVDTEITYFSPCTAGCNGYENLNGLVLFNNCTCGTNRVVRGSCTLQSCRLAFSAYQIFYPLTIAVSAAAFIMQGMVVLRAVKRWDKCIAQGFTFSTMIFLTNVPGHLFYQFISDLTCANSGNDRTTCIFNRSSLWWVAATSAIFSFLSAVLSIISSKMNPDLGGTTYFDNESFDQTRVPETIL